MTWEESIQAYLIDCKVRHRVHSTQLGQARELRLFQDFCSGLRVFTLGQLKSKHIAAYAHWLKERGQREFTVYTTIGTILRWLKWLTYHEHILENPGADWQPRHPAYPANRKVPTETQVEVLLEAPPKDTPQGLRDLTLLEFLYGTGVRLQECAKVELQDLSLEQQTVRVQGKGDKPRLQPLGPRLCEKLDFYLREIRPALATRAGVTAMFLNDCGNQLRSHSIAARMRLYSRHIGDEPFTAHSLRHAFATHLLLGGAPLWAVAKLLGHESVSCTAIYTRLMSFDVRQELIRTHPRSKARGKSAKNQEP